jgi:nucleoid-associated protein YgaU
MIGADDAEGYVPAASIRGAPTDPRAGHGVPPRASVPPVVASTAPAAVTPPEPSPAVVTTAPRPVADGPETAPVTVARGTTARPAREPMPTAPPPQDRGGGLARLILVPLLVLVVAVGVAAAAGYALSQVVARAVSVATPDVSVPPPTPRATRSAPPASPTPRATPSTAPTGGGSPSPSATPTDGSPSASPRIHVVKRGESLSIIAERYGVSLEALIEANDIDDPNKIEVGQELVIPSD